MIKTIAHPTDFSPASSGAFAHALRLAMEFRAKLDLLHVKYPEDDDAWDAFPHVRETLARWGVLPEDASYSDMEHQLGISVRKVEIGRGDPVAGIIQFLLSHRADLIVVATHGRSGFNRWLSGSVAQDVAHRIHLPTLFIGPSVRPFVDIETGELRLTNVVVPVASQPEPGRALDTLERLMEPLSLSWDVVHVGDVEPIVVRPSSRSLSVKLVDGPVVETILAEVDVVDADLIAMPMEGRHGFLDALRGSTTERILHQARCPLLALPA
jgi:nucleotide-binding universal stress UspA family protein